MSLSFPSLGLLATHGDSLSLATPARARAELQRECAGPFREDGPSAASPQASVVPSSLGPRGGMLPGAALDRPASHKLGDRAGSTGVLGESTVWGLSVQKGALLREATLCHGQDPQGLGRLPEAGSLEEAGKGQHPCGTTPHALCSGATLPSPSRPRSPHSWSPPHPDPRSSPHNQRKPPNWHHPRLGTSQSQGEVRRVVGVLVPGFPRSLGHGE